MKVCPKCFTEVEDTTRFCPNCGEAVPAQTQKDEHGLLGKTVADKYVVLELIGEGAMGSIYRAEQVALGKTVCIKVLHPHLTGDVTLSKRFHREARAASRIKHPNAINIIDFGTTAEGTHYIAMDFIDGMDLAHLLKKDFPLAPARILYITDQICSALDEAHAQGIVHRDLKPENIMVEDRRHQKDFVTVLDFGIAKIRDPGRESPDTFHTMAGIVCGTPEYMSPEQARGEVLDSRADIYSLGIILYQLATGKLPFTGDTPIGVVTKHLTVEPPAPRQVNPAVHPALEQVIIKLIMKDKNARPGNCMEVKQLLKEVRRTLEKEDVSLSHTAPMTRPSLEELAKEGGKERSATDTSQFEKPEKSRSGEAAASDEDATEASVKLPASHSGLLVGVLVAAVLIVAGIFGYQEFMGGESASGPDTAGASASASSQLSAASKRPGPGSQGAGSGKAAAAKAEEAKKLEAAAALDNQQKLLARAAAATRSLQEQKQQYDIQCEKLQQRRREWEARKRDDKAGEAVALSSLCAEGSKRAADALESATQGRVDDAEKGAAFEVERMAEFVAKASALLSEELPELADLEAKARLQLQELSGNVVATRTILSNKASLLEVRKTEWTDAGQPAKAEAVSALSGQVKALDKDLDAIQSSLSVDNLDQLVAEFAKADGKQKLLMPQIDQALSEPVVLSPEVAAKKKAEEEKAREEEEKRKAEEKKKKEEWEAKRKAEEEKKAAEAAAASKKAEEEAKKQEAKAKAEKLVALGDEAVSASNYAKAVAFYKEALSLSPNAVLHKKIGVAYNSWGNFPKGAEHLKTYLKLMEGKLTPVQVELVKKQIRE